MKSKIAVILLAYIQNIGFANMVVGAGLGIIFVTQSKKYSKPVLDPEAYSQSMLSGNICLLVMGEVRAGLGTKYWATPIMLIQNPPLQQNHPAIVQHRSE